MDLTLISALMRTLATVAGMVSSDKSTAAVSSALNYGATLVELGATGEEKLKELNSQIEAMVNGTAPLTDADFDALKARSDAAHSVIQNS